MNMAETRIDAITGTAGAGFRLSLVLNAVKAKMEIADVEIQKISKGISDFSLMLKQVARTMEEAGPAPTPLAVDTVIDIKDHSLRVFDEIKSLTELAQVRDEKGQLKEIGIGHKVVWSFKKQKVPYLLGQLDYLKLNLAIMLQVLQLGKLLSSHRPHPPDKVLMQERAEIQNMIVLQHFSFEGLRGLYTSADDETGHDSTSPTLDDPPPRYDAGSEGEVRVAIGAPERPPKIEEGPSKAMVPFREQPLRELDESLRVALTRQNQALSANVPDIVNYLLSQWVQQHVGPHHPPTQRPLTHFRPLPKIRRYNPHYSSNSEEDTTESEYEQDERQKGYYIEGARSNGAQRNVRFHPKVEDDIDEEDTRPKKSSRRHILQHHDEDSSDSQSPTSPVANPHRPLRRDSTTSTNSSASRYELPGNSPVDRPRRPYGSGSWGEASDNNSNRQRSIPRNMPTMPPATMPPTSVPQRPMPMPHPNHHWQSQSNVRNLGPPQFNGPPGAPQRMSTTGHIPQVIPGGGAYIPPRQPIPVPTMQPPRAPTRSRPHRTESRHNSREEKRKEREQSASHNLKKGIGIGAAAAGLLELLSGLDGI